MKVRSVKAAYDMLNFEGQQWLCGNDNNNNFSNINICYMRRVCRMRDGVKFELFDRQRLLFKASCLPVHYLNAQCTFAKRGATSSLMAYKDACERMCYWEGHSALVMLFLRKDIWQKVSMTIPAETSLMCNLRKLLILTPAQ
uniref:Uncharacterized protein n=1 Tax=Glossina pallidipes TaxID=7398 RepID=A0A1A9ZFL7_GLOPL